MEKTTLKYFSDNMDAIVNSDEKAFYYCIMEETEVNYGNAEDCDVEYCNEHNIPCYHVDRRGGTIVCSKGNVGVSVLLPVSTGWIYGEFVKALKLFLERHEVKNITIERNDLLVDGYKVASGVETRVGDHLKWIYFTAQISINVDMEAIGNICKKEMVKIPKGLSEYGITTEMVEEFVLDFFKDYE